MTIALLPPATVQGTVTDLVSGRPVDSSVTVFVMDLENFVSATDLAETGTFQIDNLPPGSAVLVAHAEGFAPSLGTLTVEAGKQRDAHVRLVLQAAVSGSVVDQDGAVTGARILAGYSALPGGEYLEGFIGGQPLTDADGNFALVGLVPDTPVTLQAELDGRTSDVVTVTVGPGTMQQMIELTLP